MTVGGNIKKLRKARGLSQFDFAKKIGISRNYVSELERDKRSPSVRTLKSIADKLDIPITLLLEGL